MLTSRLVVLFMILSTVTSQVILRPEVTSFRGCLQRCFQTHRCSRSYFENGRCYFRLHALSRDAQIQRIPLTTSASLMKDMVDQPAAGHNGVAPDLKNIKTQYFETYIPGGELVSGVDDADQCYHYCYHSKKCAGIDFSYISLQCFEHSWTNECNDLKLKAGTMHYRLKHNCNPVTTHCNNIVIQDLPIGFRRVGGHVVARNTDFESCREHCVSSLSCQAIDWHVTNRTCWEFDTASFPVSAPCCRHSRKVCADSVQDRRVTGERRQSVRRG